jgi:hypothetical protein
MNTATMSDAQLLQNLFDDKRKKEQERKKLLEHINTCEIASTVLPNEYPIQ